ncbi:MAG: ribokinase [Candidatus Bathyarchaeia archaeon]
MMIAVLGSANIDLVFQVERLPRFGETIAGKSYNRFPGGKGANQAAACGRLRADVVFLGKVGDDPFGEELLRSLQNSGVNVDYVKREEGVYTGTTAIFVSPSGENAILYLAGANRHVDEAYVDTVLDVIMSSSVLLMQFEIPITTIAYLLRKLPPAKPLVILDPAPAYSLSSLPTNRIDIITPNVTELESLTGTSNVEIGGKKLLNTGVKHVICKVGEEGAWLIARDQIRHFPSFHVPVVDTTAAGDAFNGALAVALAEGLSLEEGIVWGNAAGALACTRRGAQPSLPFREEVEKFLALYKYK